MLTFSLLLRNFGNLATPFNENLEKHMLSECLPLFYYLIITFFGSIRLTVITKLL